MDFALIRKILEIVFELFTPFLLLTFVFKNSEGFAKLASVLLLVCYFFTLILPDENFSRQKCINKSLKEVKHGQN